MHVIDRAARGVKEPWSWLQPA